MYKHMFGIEKLPSYMVMVVLGLVSAMLIYRFMSVTYKISDKAFARMGLVILIAIALGFVFAYLFQMMYDAIAGKPVSLRSGGITFMGGLVGGIVSFYLIAFFAMPKSMRKELWSISCIAPIAVTAAHSFGRIGCFLGGCCYGKETDSWIGVLFPGHSHERIPTQLVEAIFLAVLFAVLLILVLKFKRYSLTAPVYLFAYSVFRFVIEFFRGDDSRSVVGALSPSQWQSLLMFAGAAALSVYMFYFKRIPFNGKQDKSAGDLTKFLVRG